MGIFRSLFSQRIFLNRRSNTTSIFTSASAAPGLLICSIKPDFFRIRELGTDCPFNGLANVERLQVA